MDKLHRVFIVESPSRLCKFLSCFFQQYNLFQFFHLLIFTAIPLNLQLKRFYQLKWLHLLVYLKIWDDILISIFFSPHPYLSCLLQKQATNIFRKVISFSWVYKEFLLSHLEFTGYHILINRLSMYEERTL